MKLLSSSKATENNVSVKNDFAIIRLQDEVSLNENINVIQLPKEGASCPSGMQFVVSGWGMDRPKSPGVPLEQAPSSTRFLQAVKQECLDISECEAYGNDDPSLVFCVGDGTNPENSVCKGDSGGKILTKKSY